MRLELGSIKVAKGRAEWVAAVILVIPFVGLIVLLAALGVGYAALLGMTIALGISASRARVRLARPLHDRGTARGVERDARRR